MSELVCIDAKPDSPCEGEVRTERSASGATESNRCRKHRDEYLDRMDRVKRDIDSRYPGWDRPGSPPPDWFDPSYAGERWDDDY